jgi:hypothetical protein
MASRVESIPDRRPIFRRTGNTLSISPVVFPSLHKGERPTNLCRSEEKKV